MKQLNLPFRLGMDYEELEFDLEILPDRIQGYDSYIYLGEFNKFLNYTTDKIELLFRMDVLEGIVISYDNIPLIASEDIIAKLENILGSPQIVYEQDYKLYKFDMNDNFVTWLTSVTYTNHILISSSSLIYLIFTSLLW